MKVDLDLKVVMDTNVFVSGVFFGGPPYQILKAWQLGEFELTVSREILDEYRRVERSWKRNILALIGSPF